MKIHYLFVLAILLFLSSCNSQPTSYSINGNLNDTAFNGKEIYILRYDDGKYIDSTIVENGTFSFSGKADTAMFCRIEAIPYYANFILENGTINVDLKKPNSPSGTLLNNKLTRLFALDDSMYTVNENETSKFDNIENIVERTARKKEYFENVFKPEYKKLMQEIYSDNTNNEIGIIALTNLTDFLTPDQTDSLIAKGGDLLVNSKRVKKIIMRNETLRKTMEGMPFTNFTVQTDEGEKSLSDYVGKGKYTLVDFWASWCMPCRKEIPVIAEVYAKYKDKGLDVVGVATWDKPENTKKAIEELNITWPQILNAGSIPPQTYGFSGIPYLILFAPDGTILARGLRGDDLKVKIAEVIDPK